MGAVLTFSFKKAASGGFLIAVDDTVGGYAPAAGPGLKDLPAPVDEVLGDQVARLKRSIEGGAAAR